MSDSGDSTTNDSYFDPSSPEHSPTSGCEEDKPQTVPRLGGTPPLSSVGLNEKSSDGASQQPAATYQPALQEQLVSCEELVSRKRSMTLNLESPGACQRSSKQGRCSSLLPSPDLQNLALSTPELERLIINLNGKDSTVSRLFLLTMSEEEECLSDFPNPQPPQPALHQDAMSGPDTSDSVDSTSNDSSSHQPTATYRPTPQEQLLRCEELVSRRRSMTLDLKSPGACQRSSKQARCSSLLTSPDLQKLALSTPELERFILNLSGRDSTVRRLSLLTMSEEEEQCLSDFPNPQPPQPALHQQATSGPDTSDSVDSTSNDSSSHQPTATYRPTLQEQLLSCEVLVSRKRSMTLDLESPGACRRSSTQARCSSLLTSPDLQNLALSTPELERFILNLNGKDLTLRRQSLLTMSEEEEQCLNDFPNPQPPQPALHQHATSGPDTSDSVDSTSNDSSSHQPTATYRPTLQEQLLTCEDLVSRKRSMTLDLESPGACQRSSKQARCSSLLASPDLQKLALSTPELERFILNLNGKDSNMSRLFLLTVSEEQCLSGFSYHQPPQLALHQHATSGSVDSTSNDSSSRTSSPALQTVPRLSSTPPQSPIDMRNRERIRLERRRESNRIAALKCHQRKLDRISELEQKVNALKAEKTALEYDTSVLRRDVYQLFQVVRMHIKAGCTM
ncbi:uncharacterized protein LOC119405710 [Rhipicephalus sanguineus]|uniref:uncharacterized protein LOC119405710 n=1 Tax=Rhipicephalus sanguineus TaxID=34632 RepID=UPI0018932AF3|nr:uncharacterized protein LOC119405710 [Rhipicephalus sanguineus]